MQTALRPSVFLCANAQSPLICRSAVSRRSNFRARKTHCHTAAHPALARQDAYFEGTSNDESDCCVFAAGRVLLRQIESEGNHQRRRAEQNQLRVERSILVTDCGNDGQTHTVMVERYLIGIFSAVAPHNASRYIKEEALAAVFREPTLADINIAAILVKGIPEVSRAIFK